MEKTEKKMEATIKALPEPQKYVEQLLFGLFLVSDHYLTYVWGLGSTRA